MNAFIALCIGLVIWALLLACALALIGFERDEHGDDERIDSIRAELDRQEMKTNRVRAGT